jgi:hypothetical protein
LKLGIAANLSTSLPLAIAGRSRAEKRGPCSFWHPDPARQLVITLSGALEFTTHDGRFSLRSGDVLFTEDTVAGHDWKLLGDQPWRRLYAILDQVTAVPFRADLRSAIASREARTAKAATTTGEDT